MKEIELKLVAEPRPEGGISYSFQDEEGTQVKFKGNLRAEIDLQPTEILILGSDSTTKRYVVGITLELPLVWKDSELADS